MTTFSNTDISTLPAPVQRYLQTCGFIGTPQRMECQIVWSEVAMRFSATGNWKKIECYELLSASQPGRLARMRTRNFPPVTAKDEYANGHGSMLIRLAGILTLQHAKGREMDQSALVTLLSESLLLPACALQPYIQWMEKDPHCAAAAIRHGATEATGFFYFNDGHEFTSFETTDRWQSQKNGSFIRTPWKMTATAYIDDGGIRRPSLTTASWLNDGQWWDYFKGRIIAIR